MRICFISRYGHTLALLEDGSVWTQGNHTEGQRALDPDAEDPPAANRVPLPGPATAIAAGNHHNLAVVAGRVYAFGSEGTAENHPYLQDLQNR